VLFRTWKQASVLKTLLRSCRADRSSGVKTYPNFLDDSVGEIVGSVYAESA
jgi:hypothetical protein